MQLILTKRNDVWLDNGILLLYEMIKNIEERDSNVVKAHMYEDRVEVDIQEKQEFIKSFESQVFHKLNNILLKWQDEKEVEKKVIKEHVLMQYGKKVNGQNTVGEKLFDRKQAEHIIEAFVSQGKSVKRPQICLLCSEKYDSTTANKLSINKIKQAIYPLATKNSAISHIRTSVNSNGMERGSGAANFTNICPRCYVLGVMQYANNGLIFNSDISKSKSYMFIPEINNLEQAYYFRNSYINKALSPNKRYCNIKLPELETAAGSSKQRWINGKYTAFIAFLEKLSDIEEYKGTKGLLDFDVKSFKDWYVIEANIGKLRNPVIKHIRIMDVLYNLIFESKIKPYNGILRNIWFSKREISDERKEIVARSLFEDNFQRFASAFKTLHGEGVHSKGSVLKELNNLIYVWRWKPVGLSEELLREIENVGYSIGMVSCKRKSLVYSLEKVRDREGMLAFLAEFSKSLNAVWEELKKDFGEDRVKYIGLDNIKKLTNFVTAMDDKHFKTVKNTLLINAFIQLTRVQQISSKKKEAEGK